ncbi:hypothetical protein M2444_003602 [Paenibacillus sp. PastF-3]|uniref:hypothetical protein n=1 Tax=unclassified Paenibacillus TaxID=185978 RepID=UPI002477000E|nr:hypothetical protein [Paenibacillus sp. PastF-3]MDH6371803.1 hypothetical protein [Paenibacillus sp. PastF-3]
MNRVDEQRIREIIQEELQKEREIMLELIQKRVEKGTAAAGTAALDRAIKQSMELKSKGIY